MDIAGLQKMALLDYPGRVACTVFLQGCNFRCPFCHNSELIPGKGEVLMTDGEFLGFLKKRKGLLDGVCVSGGEPTLQPELPEFLTEIKALGFAVKLDTNGGRPEVLKDLVSRGLVDYVAMDVKNSPERFAETAGKRDLSLEPIEESLRFLLSGAVDHELRTTVVAEFHDEESILRMGQWLEKLAGGKKIKKLYLQPFADRDSVLFTGLHKPEDGQMDRFCAHLAPFAELVAIRG